MIAETHLICGCMGAGGHCATPRHDLGFEMPGLSTYLCYLLGFLLSSFEMIDLITVFSVLAPVTFSVQCRHTHGTYSQYKPVRVPNETPAFKHF